MLKKRGQLTLFVIIGAVIVAAILGYYFLKSSSQDSFSNPEANSKYNILKDAFIDCHSSLSINIIELVGIQGGYYEFSDKMLYEESFIFDYPYYYYESQEYLPSIESISKEIAKGIDDTLISECVETLNGSNFEIEYQKSKTTVQIKKDKIDLSTNLDIIFIKGNERRILSVNDYPTSLSSKITPMYNIAKFLTNENIINPNLMNIAELTSLTEDNNLYVSIINYNDDPLITQIFISDNSTASPSLFIYLNKYSENKE